MSYPGPGAQPIFLIVDGDPVSGSNPLPTTGGGGGGGTVDQGKAGSAPQSWYVRDGSGLLATAAKQDTGNASLVSILGQLDNKTSTLATASAQTTANSSLSSIDGKVATAAKQDTGNTSLSSIDSKVATAANQTTANSSLASILGQLDNKTSTLATEATASASKTLLGAGLPAALVGGKLDINLGTSSITLPVSQGAGSGATGTFWYTRNTDGTNTQPTMDTAARSGFQRITDGTNTAAVKAASTAAVATDPALVATEKGCSWYNTVVNATALVRAGVTVLRCIIVNQGTASSLTLYDNGSGTATGTNFGITTGGAGGGLPFFIDCGKMTFVNGLTIVTAGTSPANVTLVYEP